MTQCKQCGVMFQALNGGFRYCDACGNSYGTRACRRCGQAFRTRERGRRFCSQLCGAQRGDIWLAFTQHVALQPDERGCFLWKGPLRGNFWQRNNMYGVVHYKSRRLGAHRFAWEQRHGPIPKGLIVRHKCDNPLCVHVEHLELGTACDNTRDILKRGRWGDHTGERSGVAKLNEFQVRLIRKRRKLGLTLSQLAREFGVNVPCIHKIVRRESWAHVKDE